MVYGVGIRDLPFERGCKFYDRWRSMLRRAYCPKTLEKFPTYADVTVCTEWLKFSNFKKWMETQDWQGKQLDKDLLVRGNKVYSPEACCFVTVEVNNFITLQDAKRGDLPLGCSYNSMARRYQATVKNTYIGLFDSPEEAHAAYLKEKIKIAGVLASKETDARIAEALLRYFVL